MRPRWGRTNTAELPSSHPPPLCTEAMAEDTAAYTLKPGPKAELDSLRTAREESGPIAPRPGACPIRVSPRVHPPHISYVLRV